MLQEIHLKCISGTKWKQLYTLSLEQLITQSWFSLLTLHGELLFAWDQVLKMNLILTRKCIIWLERDQCIDAIFVDSVSRLLDSRMKNPNWMNTTVPCLLQSACSRFRKKIDLFQLPDSIMIVQQFNSKPCLWQIYTYR